MKFWQLVAMFRPNLDRLSMLLTDSRWEQYRAWLQDYDSIVRQQRREILDGIIPDDLCRSALQTVGLRFYIKNKNVYLYTPESCGEVPAQLLTATEVYDRWGPNAIEEILEYSSIQLP